MLFFNPGKKIAGIPLIGNKLDLYDASAHELYDYKLDYVDYHGQLVYVFDVQPKSDLGFFAKDRVVVDQMITWFNPKTLEVLGRNYSLSYKAGVYDFNVQMEVEMTYTKNGLHSVANNRLHFRSTYFVGFTEILTTLTMSNQNVGAT